MDDSKNSTGMNPINPQNKILGVALGLVALGSVSYVTLFGENKSASMTTPAPTPAQMYPDAVPQNTPITNTVSIPKTNTPIKQTVQKWFDDEEGEEEGDDDDDDEGGSNTPNQPLPTPTPAPVITTKPLPTKTSTLYKNGTYSATGSYMSPGGYDEIGVTVTLKDDVITSVSAVNMAGDNTSSRYEDRFISGMNQYVVGQNIKDVYLTKISGASLTPKGFNDAINQIKVQAKA